MHSWLDALNSLVTDEVTDIFVSSTSGVWIHSASGAVQTPWHIAEVEARALAVHLIDCGGRHIDEANPCADVALAGGVRVHAVLAGVSTSGTEISIRLPRARPMSLSDFMSTTDAPPQRTQVMRRLVRERQTFVITGSTGSGKTTLLAALMECAPVHERIVAIEDVSELQMNHPRVASLQSRQANYEDRGAISIEELIRQALRMRPDRLILGECRGPEVLHALLAFTTGHPGGGATLHAHSPRDALVRLRGLLGLAGLSDDAGARLIVSAIGVLAHIHLSDHGRRLWLGRPVLVVNASGRMEIDLEEIE